MICRDVDWWDSIARHPEVAPHIFMGEDCQSLAPLVSNPLSKPYAAPNGGVIFCCMDHAGMVYEMHTLFTPEGWGREVATYGKSFVNDLLREASLILTHEQEGNWRSRPPKSHGWKSCGDYCYIGLPKRLKLWSLSREDWLSSPVGRKMQCQ